MVLSRTLAAILGQNVRRGIKREIIIDAPPAIRPAKLVLGVACCARLRSSSMPTSRQTIPAVMIETDAWKAGPRANSSSVTGFLPSRCPSPTESVVAGGDPE